MGQKYNKWLLPIVFAMVLFLCIRVANDIPKREKYWEGNDLVFMLVDMLTVILFSFPAVLMLQRQVRWNLKKKLPLWQEYSFLVLGTLIWCVVTMWLIRLLAGKQLDFYDLPIPVVVSVLFISFFYTYLRHQLVQQENELQRLQLEKIKNDQLQTELKFLKAQYHPHFLFNVLNTVYFQIDEANPAPRHTLEILSDLLRYQLYNDREKVPVRAEIHYLERYISLWKLRCTERLSLQVHFGEALQEQAVYPLLFVPLVENAFKYVGGEYRIVLNMYPEGDELHFDIENTVPAMPMPQKERQGIGIENMKRRLDLLYPGCHTLKMDKIENVYKVNLIIKL